VAGKYKLENGPAACSNCMAGQYSMTIGAISDVCVPCSSNSNSPEASNVITNCTCNPGFTGPDGESCRICVAGKFKAARGTAECSQCAAGKYSTAVGAGSDVCQACQADSMSPISSAQVSDCVCNPVFTGFNGGTCVQCVAGKYKIEPGDAACTNCLSGQYSTAIGAITNVCQNCPTNSDALSGSDAKTDCTCDPGSTGADGVVCVNCVPGTYKIQRGSATCTKCVSGQYSTAVGATSNVCQECLADSNSPESSNQAVDCTCNSGFTGPDGGMCSECVVGKYKIDSGDTQCTNCPERTFSAVLGANTSAVCQTCSGNFNTAAGSVSQSDCICDAGSSGPNGGTCIKCIAGTYKILRGDTTCVSCLSAKYSTVVGATTNACAACPSNSNSLEASDALVDCICNAGSTGPNGRDCKLCVAGTYKVMTGDAACSQCPMGRYSDKVGSISNTCLACRAGTFSNTIAAGSIRHCQRCAPGTSTRRLEAQTSQKDCIGCPVGTYTSISDGGNPRRVCN